jgi:hypothetical protein
MVDAVNYAVPNGTNDDIIINGLAIAADGIMQAYHFRSFTSCWLMSKRTVSVVINIPTLMAPHNEPIFQTCSPNISQPGLFIQYTAPEPET